MALPRTRKNVPRARVDDIVRLFLGNPEVGDIDCIEQSNHQYTIRARGRTQMPPADVMDSMNN